MYGPAKLLPSSAQAEAAILRVRTLVSGTNEPQLGILAMLAVVESFVDDRISFMLEDEAELVNSQLLEYLLDEHVRGKAWSWPERNRILQRVFGVIIVPEATAQDLDLLIDVRNALAHGDGRYTRLQVKSPKKLLIRRSQAEERLRVRHSGTSVAVSDATLRAAGEVVCAYLKALDDATLGRDRAEADPAGQVAGRSRGSSCR